jgi:hypothetical protein
MNIDLTKLTDEEGLKTLGRCLSQRALEIHRRLCEKKYPYSKIIQWDVEKTLEAMSRAQEILNGVLSDFGEGK